MLAKLACYLQDDEFTRRVVGAAQLFAETQRDAALRLLAAVGAETVEFWSEEKTKKKTGQDLKPTQSHAPTPAPHAA